MIVIELKAQNFRKSFLQQLVNNENKNNYQKGKHPNIYLNLDGRISQIIQLMNQKLSKTIKQLLVFQKLPNVDVEIFLSKPYESNFFLEFDIDMTFANRQHMKQGVCIKFS